MRPVPRLLGVALLIAAGAIAALGYAAMQRDTNLLDSDGRGAMLWWGAQIEIDMLKLELGLANLRVMRNEQSVRETQTRFDALWSRIAMMRSGAIAQRLREFSGDERTLADLSAFLRDVDPVITSLRPDDGERVDDLRRRLAAFHKPVRLFTLDVMRSDSEIAADLHERISWSARSIVSISGLSLFVALVSIFLMMRDNQNQRAMARMSQRAAESAELASRAKSRLLTMMSHELRNPLNGVLGPLALLNQSDIGPRQRRLVEQASQSGQALSRMLQNLLDYGEIQDGKVEIRAEPLRPRALAEMIRTRVIASTGVELSVRIAPDMPAILSGDSERLSQIFVQLAEHLIEGRAPGDMSLAFGYAATALVGELRVNEQSDLDWKLDLLLRLDPAVPGQLTADALRPLVARGLLAALRGELSVAREPGGDRVVRVKLPARELALKQVRIFLDTRSKALAAIYRAALRSDEVIFDEGTCSGPVDLVLVDAARSESEAVMAGLRERYPKALFVALGQPERPDVFDEVVPEPNDFEGLRTKIMHRLAS